MSNEPYIKDHQAWIGALQPDGLVVSPAALVDAQAILNIRGIETQQRFIAALGAIKDADDKDQPAIIDFAHFARTFLEWPDEFIFAAGDAARPLPDQLTVALSSFHETLTADLAFQDPDPKDPAQPWMILIQTVQRGLDLDKDTTGTETNNSGWTASASRRFERLLRETGVPIGLLCNATHLRLMYAPRGENAGSITFPIAFMTQNAGRPIVSALELLLHSGRLLTGPAESRLPALLKRSREFQARVSIELAQQVIDAAFELLRGLQAANSRTEGALLQGVLEKEPAKVYEGLLTVLMRLVFILYSEDRGLMPGGSVYQQHYSVHGLFERLRADDVSHPDTMDQRYGAWAHLLALFRAIYGGCKHPLLSMPAREGYLFDPDRFPFLEGRVSAQPARLPLVPDSTVFNILEKLLILNGERLSYRTLDVEQIGSVYEVMMGFGVGIAAGQSIAIKPKKAHGAPVPIDLDELLNQPGADRAKWLKLKTDQELSAKPAADMKSAETVDDLLAALELGRRIARSATPHPVPKGSMLLVPSDERRRSGSNYTPRSLTEPIVRKTLEPIIKRLGDDVKPEQILDLKVCDPAMGSGAFLVEACRQLAEHLVKAWHRHKLLPTVPPDEDELLYAKRLIAQRCLYGVDKNPMAADLAKLSMWLATLARDHPFTFLDHSFRAGDSLVGLTKAQITAFSWSESQAPYFDKRIVGSRIASAMTQRMAILDGGDMLNPDSKRAKLEKADEELNLVRFIGDLAVAAFFAGSTDKERKQKRTEYLTALDDYLVGNQIARRPAAAVAALRTGEKGVTPFHWEIEFPEVFGRENPGFDAIVGNPPFLGGTRVTSAFGGAYRDWLSSLHPEGSSNADLSGHFFRRAFAVLHADGCFGLIATNSIAQGDTRALGLGTIVRSKGNIYSAQRRYGWPGAAAVVVSVIHVQRRASLFTSSVLDGRPVQQITAFLSYAGSSDEPRQLRSNAGKSFRGCDVFGIGFVFDDRNPKANPLAEMNQLLAMDPRNSERILPYVSGEEFNTNPSLEPTRYIIDFGEMSEGEARRWPLLFSIIEQRVRPARLHVTQRDRRELWWLYATRSPSFRRFVAEHGRCLGIAQVSDTFGFGFVTGTPVVANSIVTFALDTHSAFCVVQCRVHETWARFFSSTLKDDLQYTPSDCFDTFAFPADFETDPRLETAGQAYYEFRAALMVRNNEGLTKTYNRFHDPEETSPDILKLRDLHAAMDRAVLDAYGWKDIPTACEFLLDYEEDEEDGAAVDTGKGRKKRKPYRYRWPDAIRDEVLARLLALNAQRAEKERISGAAVMAKEAKAGVRKAGRPKSAKKAGASDGQLMLGQGDA